MSSIKPYNHLTVTEKSDIVHRLVTKEPYYTTTSYDMEAAAKLIENMREEIDQLRTERDEARRMYCEECSSDSGRVSEERCKKYALRCGWDCYITK